MLIISYVLIQIFFAYSLVYGDCGIPGVPAFARIIGISSDFNINSTLYPEGYVIKYDCLTYGLNINGIDTRTCKNSEWEPWQLPYCGIEKLTDFAIEVKHENKTDNGLFKNNLKLFSSKQFYLITKKQLFSINVSSNRNYLWKIKFAHNYQVEKHHSLLAVMLFAIPYTDAYNYSNIGIDINKSYISSSKRTCKTKIELDYISSLFRDNTNSTVINDRFYRITIECRNEWSLVDIRWRQTSDNDVITELNLNLSMNTRLEIELILTQFILNVDCGYPDAPVNSNYTKQWGNAVFGCTDGQLTGNSRLSCNSDGQWNEKAVKCCINDHCERTLQYVENKLGVVWITIIALTVVVIVLIVMAVVLAVRSVKRQKLADIERAKRQIDDLDNYDDTADENYEQIDEQQYDEINYSEIGKCSLELYDDNQLEARYTRNDMTKTGSSDRDYGYVEMESFDDGYVVMTATTKLRTNNMAKHF